MSAAACDKKATRGIAHQQLVADFTAAIKEAPESTVFTPGWNKYRATVAEVINDNFEAEDKSLHELLRIVRNAAKGVDVRLQACAWIDAEAKRFAEIHETDRATELAEGL